MRMTVVTCDNCGARDDQAVRFRLPSKVAIDLCGPCGQGKPRVDVEAPLGTWPRMIRASSVRAVLEERERARTAERETNERIARLDGELRRVRSTAGEALRDLDSDLLAAVRDVVSSADRVAALA